MELAGTIVSTGLSSICLDSPGIDSKATTNRRQEQKMLVINSLKSRSPLDTSSILTISLDDPPRMSFTRTVKSTGRNQGISDVPLFFDRRSQLSYFGMNVAARKIGLTRDQLEDVLTETEAGRDMINFWGMHQNTKGDGARKLLNDHGIHLLRTFRKRYKNIDWDNIPDEVRDADLTSKAQRQYTERVLQQWRDSEDARPAREAGNNAGRKGQESPVTTGVSGGVRSSTVPESLPASILPHDR
jgi:hypothetical protein